MAELIPITLRAACAFVAAHHRHNEPPRGHKLSIGVEAGGELLGVAIIGRPVSRKLQENPRNAEVLRVCVPGELGRLASGHANGLCSMLYAASWRCWRAQGGSRLVTYALESESGHSLRAAGFVKTAEVEPREGWGRPSRERAPDPIHAEPKWRWEIARG